LAADIVNPEAGTNVNYYVQLNDDDGASDNYQRIVATTTTVAALRSDSVTGMYLGIISQDGAYRASLMLWIPGPKSGKIRQGLSFSHFNVSPTTAGGVGIYGYSWENSIDEIVSLRLLGDSAGGLGVGTEWALYGGQE